MAEVLKPLPGPYEIFELASGETRELRIVGWERGTIVIHPRFVGGPEEKVIECLRVHLPEGFKPYPPGYYDVTAKTLIWQLMPFLREPRYERQLYRITKYGVAPKARFTLAVVPL